jgi:hypothetical protein
MCLENGDTHPACEKVRRWMCLLCAHSPPAPEPPTGKSPASTYGIMRIDEACMGNESRAVQTSLKLPQVVGKYTCAWTSCQARSIHVSSKPESTYEQVRSGVH